MHRKESLCLRHSGVEQRINLPAMLSSYESGVTLADTCKLRLM